MATLAESYLKTYPKKPLQIFFDKKSFISQIFYLFEYTALLKLKKNSSVHFIYNLSRIYSLLFIFIKGSNNQLVDIFNFTGQHLKHYFMHGFNYTFTKSLDLYSCTMFFVTKNYSPLFLAEDFLFLDPVCGWSRRPEMLQLPESSSIKLKKKKSNFSLYQCGYETAETKAMSMSTRAHKFGRQQQNFADRYRVTI